MIGPMLIINASIASLRGVAGTIISASPLLFDAATDSVNLFYKSETKEKIKALVKKKSESLGFNKKVEVKTCSNPFGAQAYGIHFLPFRCGIVVDTNKISEDARPFIVAHELSHIKSNDLLTVSVVGQGFLIKKI